jgi:integrase
MSPKRLYLQSIDGVWRYRRRWPTSLRHKVEGEFYIRHLGTTDLDEAARLRPVCDAHFNERVAALRTAEDKSPRKLDESEAFALAARWMVEEEEPFWFLDSLQTLEEHRQAGEMQQLEEEIDHLETMLGRNDFSEAEEQAKAFLAKEGVMVDPDSLGYRRLLQLMMRGWRELARRREAQLLGNTDYASKDVELAAAVQAAREEKSKRTLADLLKAYEESKEQKNRWTQSTRAAHKPVFRLLKDTLGSTRDVASIDREDGRRLFDMMVRLPKGLGKVAALKGLPVPEAVDKATELGLPTISPKTINDSYFVFSKAIFSFAVDEGWVERNPLAGDYRVADPVAEEDKRDPFRPEQLQVLFGAEPWQSGYDERDTKPSRFWVPLICLFHGLRLGEAAGLRIEDVVEREGVPVLQVRGYEGRSLKTKGSRGLLPLHPELIRIGFLAYVSKRRDAGGEALFPDVRTNVNGKVGAKLGEWFSGLVKERGLLGERLGMHSFRHAFEDRLREAEIAERTALALARRSERGSRKGYGEGVSVQSRAAAMAKIIYPKLDLSHLHSGGQ